MLPEAAGVDRVVGRLHHDRELERLQLGRTVEQRGERALGDGQLLAREEQGAERRAGQQRARSSPPARPSCRDAPRPWTRSASMRAGDVALRRDGVEVTGQQDPRRRSARRAARARSCRRDRDTARPPTLSTAGDVRRQRRFRRATRDGMSISSSSRAARRSPSALSSGSGCIGQQANRTRSPTVAAMRYCGVDISAKPDNQQLVTLHERRDKAGVIELVATFYEPGTVEATSRARSRVSGTARRSSPSTRRRLTGSTCWPRAGPRARCSALPAGRYRAHARLRRDALPARAAAVSGSPRGPGDDGLGEVDLRRLRALRGARRAGPLRPAGPRRHVHGTGRRRTRCSTAACSRPTPTPIFCSLLGHRPAPKRTPWGLQERIDALRSKGIVDADGGLWHRTLDELDACAAAYTAYALAVGLGTWVGDPTEGVIVLPVSELRPRYDRLPPPTRERLA